MNLKETKENMKNLKYEFVEGDEIVIESGRTLKRIRLLTTLPNFLPAGTIGGYIESEKSLSKYGNSWVYDNACVYDNARVCDDACVSGRARIFESARIFDRARIFESALVYGNSCVSDDAQLSENVRVYGNAGVYGNAHVLGNTHICGNTHILGDAHILNDGQIVWFSHVGSENGTLTVYNTKDNSIEVTRGCFRGSIDEFLSASEKQHDEQTQLEYRFLFEVAYSRITKNRN